MQRPIILTKEDTAKIFYNKIFIIPACLIVCSIRSCVSLGVISTW
jgi:hypothetical protein